MTAKVAPSAIRSIIAKELAYESERPLEYFYVDILRILLPL
jgi:hypothetical protein